MLAASLIVARFCSTFTGASLYDGVGDVETTDAASRSKDEINFMMGVGATVVIMASCELLVVLLNCGTVQFVHFIGF